MALPENEKIARLIDVELDKLIEAMRFMRVAAAFTGQQDDRAVLMQAAAENMAKAGWSAAFTTGVLAAALLRITDDM